MLTYPKGQAPAPQARHHFTLFDQVTQLVNAGEAERRCHRRRTRGSTQPKVLDRSGPDWEDFPASARGACRDRPQRVSAEYTNILRAEIATVNGTVDCRLIGAVCRRLLAHQVA